MDPEPGTQKIQSWIRIKSLRIHNTAFLSSVQQDPDPVFKFPVSPLWIRSKKDRICNPVLLLFRLRGSRSVLKRRKVSPHNSRGSSSRVSDSQAVTASLRIRKPRGWGVLIRIWTDLQDFLKICEESCRPSGTFHFVDQIRITFVSGFKTFPRRRVSYVKERVLVTNFLSSVASRC